MEINNNKNISSIILIEHRCKCGKLLFKGLLLSSTLEIKCKRCNAINIIGNNDSAKNSFRYSILFDLNAQVVDASPSATEILGYTKEELMSMKMQQIDPLFNVSTCVNFSQIKDTSNVEPFIWETIHQDKKGEFFLVSTVLRYIKNQAGFYGFATFECLDTSNKILNESGQNMDIHCILSAKINNEGIYTHVSTKLATLLGYPSIEMLGKYIFQFYPTNQQEKIKQTLLQNLALKESFKLLPHAMLCKNKSTINLESYFASDFSDSGQFTGFKIMSWQILK